MRAIIPGIRSPRKSRKEEEQIIFGEEDSDVIDSENGW